MSYLKLLDKGIWEVGCTGDEEEEGSIRGDQEKEDEKEKEKTDLNVDEEDQKTVPTAVHEKAEGGSQGAQEKV